MKIDIVKERFVSLFKEPQTLNSIYRIMMNDFYDTPASQWLDESNNVVTVTFKALNENVKSMASFLSKKLSAQQQGSFIGMTMENSHLWQVCFWALLMAGFKPVLIDVNQKEDMVDYIIESAGIQAIIGKSGLELKNTILQISMDEVKSANEPSEFTPKWADNLALCTSGTTATAKVLVFDGAAISSQLEGFYRVYLKDRRIATAPTPVKLLAFLPMHHVLGFITSCIAYPFLNKTVVYLKDRSPASIQSACKGIGVTHMVSVPLLINNLKNGVQRKIRQEEPKKEKLLNMLFKVSFFIQKIAPKEGDNFVRNSVTKSVIKKLFGGTFRWICVGGTHVPVESLKFMNGLGYCATIGYGMTECGIIAFEPGMKLNRRIDGTTGPLMYSFESKIIDENGKDTHTGELLIRGKSMHIGKMQNGKMIGADIDEDGWLHTGDIAYFDQDSLVIAGRLKEVILNESGENIYPDELEDNFDNLPLVERYCILGLDNNGSDEIALVVQIQDSAKNESAMADILQKVEAVNQQLPVMKRIKKVFVANEPLPLSNGIKIRRQKLKELLENNQVSVTELKMNTGISSTVPVTSAAPGSRTSPLEKEKSSGKTGNDAEFLRIRELVRKCFADVLNVTPDKVGYDMCFVEDLGGDSLDSLGLLALAETRFGLLIEEDEYIKCRTVNDFSHLLFNKLTGAVPEKRSTEQMPDVKPVTVFEETSEYRIFLSRFNDTEKYKNPYFVRHDSVLRDTSITGEREVLNFASYNYLGMSGHPQVSEAAVEAVKKLGTSASGSRLLAGEKTLHRELESEIAKWKHTEAALVLVGGHSTNVTFVGNFCGSKDLILYDALSHNSISQGLKLSSATSRLFPHNDYETARLILKSIRNKFEKVLLVIEGVYSMDGDIAPVPEFVKLKKEFGLFLMVDEAHSCCVIGENGGGVDEYFNLDPDDIDIKMGTLSKGLGACGGYLAGKKALIEYMKYSLPGFVFSVGVSPPLAAAALESIRIMKKDNSLVRQLHENIRHFVSKAKEKGLNICKAGESAVLPILVGNEYDAFKLSAALLERDVFVPPAVYPAVPVNMARLRFGVTSCHTKEQIDRALEVLKEEAAKMNIVLPG